MVYRFTGKMQQRFPDNPPHYAPISEYMNFLEQLNALAEGTL
jgi:hypothetical protein